MPVPRRTVGRSAAGHFVSMKKDDMTPKKSLRERESELRVLLATAAGQQELQDLVSRYRAVSGQVKPAAASSITYILVHDREKGLIRV
jgi:hypothetical protein